MSDYNLTHFNIKTRNQLEGLVYLLTYNAYIQCWHCRVSKQRVHGNEPFSWWNTILKWIVVSFWWLSPGDIFGVVFLAFLLHCWCNTHLRCLPNYLCDLVLSSLATTEPSRNWTCLKAHCYQSAPDSWFACLFAQSGAGGTIWKDLPAHGLVNRGAILGSVVHTDNTRDFDFLATTSHPGSTGLSPVCSILTTKLL